jgi:hypothetical protein
MALPGRQRFAPDHSSALRAPLVRVDAGAAVAERFTSRWITAASERALATHRRLRYVDLTRGLFTLLMISSHAISVSGVPAASFIRSMFWLPRGWSTAGFVMLAGFNVGVATTPTHAVSARKLLTRALHLVLVLFASNAILAICRAIVDGNAANVHAAAWLLSVVTLQRDATISVVLLPIAAGLVLIGAAAPLARRTSILVAAPLFLAANAGAWAAHEALVRTFASMAVEPASLMIWLVSFPMLPLTAGALTGLALGLLWRTMSDAVHIDSAYVGPVVFLAVVALAPVTHAAPRPLFLSLIAIDHFLTILLLGLTIAALPHLRRVSATLSLFGRFSLMVFIGHRLLLHAADIGGQALHLGPMERYALALTTAIAGSLALCVARQRSHALNDALSRVYL